MPEHVADRLSTVDQWTVEPVTREDSCDQHLMVRSEPEDAPANGDAWLSESAEIVLPEAIESFCQQEGLNPQHVITATRLAQYAFLCGESLCQYVESDPDANERWIVIEVKTGGTIDEVLAREDTYTRQLVASVPWPQRDKIRLSYTII